jgi:hypothetical protein
MGSIALRGQETHAAWFPGGRRGYERAMSPFEELIDLVEVSIIDSVDSLDDVDAARLYAEVLDAEQRLDALRDALTLMAAART